METYSKTVNDEILHDVRSWVRECRKTKQYKQLPHEAREKFAVIAELFAHCMYKEMSRKPKKWTAKTLEDVLVQFFPDKLDVEKPIFKYVQPILAILIEYLHFAGEISNGNALITRLNTAAPKMLRAVGVPSDAVKPAAKPAAKKKNAAEPTRVQWKILYTIAKELKQMAPWRFLWDNELIAIALPGYDEPIYCSIMGRNDECYAIGVYVGNEGVKTFFRMAAIPPDEPSFISGLMQNCMICFFGDREEFQPKDRSVIDDLGIKFRGRNEWIYFRKIEPGSPPWFIDAETADLLIRVLGNLHMALKPLLSRKITVNFEKGEILFRTYSPEEGLWYNMPIEMPEITFSSQTLIIENDILLSRLSKQKRSNLRLEFDVAYFPSPIMERGDDKPYFPRMIVLADCESGAIVDCKMVHKDEKVEPAIIDALVSHIEAHGRPTSLRVRDDRTECFVKYLCEKAGIRLVVGNGMPAINEFFTHMIDDLL